VSWLPSGAQELDPGLVLALSRRCLALDVLHQERAAALRPRLFTGAAAAWAGLALGPLVGLGLGWVSLVWLGAVLCTTLLAADVFALALHHRMALPLARFLRVNKGPLGSESLPSSG